MSHDFVTTIDSDDEFDVGAGPSRLPKAQDKGEELDPDFTFDIASSSRQNGLDLWDDGAADDVTKEAVTIDDIIEKRLGHPLQAHREAKKSKALEQASDSEDEENSSENSDGSDPEEDEDESSRSLSDHFDDDVDGEDVDEEGEDDESDVEEEEEELSGDESEDEDAEDAEELKRKEAFFSNDPTSDPTLPSSFASMNLSRPLLRALTSLSLTVPTPIQARAIPLALQGRDLLGSAVTGSGKTAAFMVPILERLCYRDRGKGGQACRVLVLCPTRELAVQCEAVGKALAEKGGLDVRFALLVGGLSLNAQAHNLRTLPDILIATPGRLIDHLTNTPSFTLSALDVLVIDEADRMLEQGFTDELTEIVKACPRSRQTMLFSATMTDSVDELVRLSLDKPIRVFVDPKRSTATGLTQEFVRIRTDDTRSPCLLALCKRTVRERCIIFFRSKALAHQMKIIFGLCGLKAAELHGNLSQDQRLHALTDFKAGKVDYLLATDLASRGLDIKGVETVINYDMPGQLAQYTHRVGRTARAGRKGRSISLVGEADRKMLKTVIKQSSNEQVRHRIVPSEAVAKYSKKLSELKEDISEIMKEEREEKSLRQADMEVRKGQNMVEHEDEIFARPARTWFQSEKEKRAAKDAGKSAYVGSFPGAKDEDASAKAKIKRGKYDGMSRKVKRRKMAMEEDAKDEKAAATSAAIRAAKKKIRPGKISEPISASSKSSSNPKKGGDRGSKKKRSAFDHDGKVKKGGERHEGMRAKRVKVTLDKKGKGKGKGKGSKKR